MVFLPLSPSVGFVFCSALLIIDRVGPLLLAKVFALPDYRQLQVIYHIERSTYDSGRAHCMQTPAL